MTGVLSVDQASPGFKTRRLHISLLLRRDELADLVGVSREDVDLPECHHSLRPDAKRRFLLPSQSR